MSEKKELSLAEIKSEINTQIADPETFKSLVGTTFSELAEKNGEQAGAVVKRAMLEGMMRGFTFQDFLKKNVYAVPFGVGKYTLITSIDYSRKIGARSGVVGIDEPVYVMSEDGKTIISCSVTVHKRFQEQDGYVGDFTAKVYFKEYTTGKNQWSTKPMTMIAKVAEMHALRKACPEELAQSYVEEEMEREVSAPVQAVAAQSQEWKQKLEAAPDEEELRKVWAAAPAAVKVELKPLLEDLKKKYDADKKVRGQGAVADGEAGEAQRDEAQGGGDNSTADKG